MNELSKVGAGREGEKVLGFLVKNAIKMFRYMPWRETLARVEDTIEQIWGAAYKPYITKSVKQDNKHVFIVNLPPGITFKEFRSKVDYFSDATGGEAQINKYGRRITLEIYKTTLKTKYFYQVIENKGYLPVLFGHSPTGPIIRDIADMPNILVAGHPGSGKSNLCHVITISLLLTRNVELYIIDLKKLEFAYLRKYGHLADDLEKARETLNNISQELNRRLNLFERSGVVKIQDYAGEIPFILLIIDELAELQDEQCQELLSRIVRLGRAAGISVVASTQRPSSSIFNKFGDIKAQFACSVCYHVRDDINSRIVLGNEKASLMPFIPGRAIFQFDIETEIQTPYLPPAQAKKLLKGVKQIEQKQIARLPAR